MSNCALSVVLRQSDGRIEARVIRTNGLSVDPLVLGRPVEEAARLLGRVFSLCRHAQSSALTLAIDGQAADVPGLASEIRLDHLAQLFVHLPPLVGLAPQPLPTDQVAQALYGACGHCPAPGELMDWLAGEHGRAPVLRGIADAFAPGEAEPGLPLLSHGAAPQPGQALNVAACRVAGHPVMQVVADRFGLGPLWQAMGLLVELSELDRPGHLRPLRPRPGVALVPAARGTYLLEAQAAEGLLTQLSRLSPTDDLTVANGALERALAALPAHKAHLAPLVIACLNPCEHVVVREECDA